MQSGENLGLKKCEMRLAICLSHPIQYKSPLLRRLAKQPGLNLQVYYYSDRGIVNKKNTYHEVIPAWDIPLLDGYSSEFIPNLVNEEKWNLTFIQPFVNTKIVPLINAGKFDAIILHSYLYPSDWFAFVTAKIKRVAVLFYGDMYPSGRNSSIRRIGKSILSSVMIRGSAACLAIGSVARQVFLDEYHIPEERVFLAPYAVDNDYFISMNNGCRGERNSIKNRLGIPPVSPVVLCVAGMISVKRQIDLIDAMTRLKKLAQLVLVGHGPSMHSVQAYAIKKLPTTIFTGFVNQSELPRYYAAADLFVLPSQTEVFGLVVNEAMCASLPVITSNAVAASCDLIREGENGFTFPPGDVDQLADEIDRLLDDELLRQKFGQRSLEIISGWNLDRTVDGIMAALNYVAGRKNYDSQLRK